MIEDAVRFAEASPDPPPTTGGATSTPERGMRSKIVQALRHGPRSRRCSGTPPCSCSGEDIAVFGGAYRVTEDCSARFGEERVRDTPISEAAIIGAAVGAAMTGLRPVAEIQFNDFIACAMDQIVQPGGQDPLHDGRAGQRAHGHPRPRAAPRGRAAQHSQSLEAWFMHAPGLKVVIPSTPYDAKGLLKSAIRDDNPVMFFEHKLLYGGASPGGKAKTAVDGLGAAFRPAPDEEYLVPLGRRRREAPGQGRHGGGHRADGAQGPGGSRRAGERKGSRSR